MSTATCAVTQSAQLTPSFLPSAPLYGNADAGPGWLLANKPFGLTDEFKAELDKLGPLLWQFQWACEQLYRDSRDGKRNIPAWIATLLDMGKPEVLTTFAAMKRFKRHTPVVIRPDVLLTGQHHVCDDFVITELDSVPGGLGFTSALNQAYRASGFKVLEADNDGLPAAWYSAVTHSWQNNTEPHVAVMVSDEASDYTAELQWLVDCLKADGKSIALVHPKQVVLNHQQLLWLDDSGAEHPIDIIYRFYELFDLPNIPNAELLQFAIKKGYVQCTPPYKPQLEEKLWLALLHHPGLKPHWQALLGKDAFDYLACHVPRGWVLNPVPVPFHAAIPGLSVSGAPVQDFNQLANATQKERQLVIKPSGFSPLAWGSRGVSLGHDMKADDWAEAIDAALKAYAQSPHILQQFHKPAKHTVQRLDIATNQTTPMDARTRLCPYFLAKPIKADPINNAEITLGGVLATHCPADKKIIHGMKDGIMSPCA